MPSRAPIHRWILLTAVSCFGPAMPAFAEVDEDAAVSLAKKGNCFKCHAVDKRKKAPSYKEIAAKHQGKADAETYILRHITGNPMVKLDSEDERHESPPTKDEKELRNLVKWILSR